MDFNHTGEQPEGDLIAAIVLTAINDARAATVDKSDTAMEAIHFLMTDRVDQYLHLLGIDPEVFKEDLVRLQMSDSKCIAQESKKRRIFRFNLQRFARTWKCYDGIRNSDRIFYQLYPNGFINWPMR